MGRIGNIIDRKGKQDAKKAKIFTKYARVIAVAAREGGSDPEYNAALKTAIDKAKAMNMPNDNIDRAVKKGAGAGEGDDFENVVYEGYGPGGVAVIIEALTDNKNRTAGNVRYYLDKNGGNLGTSGCVGFMFDRKGQIMIANEGGITEDEIMETALEAGAEDIIADEEGFEIITAPEDFDAVRDALSEAGYEMLEADVKMIPQTTVNLEGESAQKMEKMIDMLEDDDDVQQIHHNWEA
ncbi:DNA-binding regulatory protein, YebC/PmpR family [Peptoclostridium litorale DSM 5388]|uniref:Probable transcriptional regulatory protein CLIT_5c00870 n=1 Tax=Peptoclostridium litorale DSM 5388 TaxID=1121324 RepID=A0A069RIW9_PEPLI|nr:YebC/PmpR family DNA-binding transcriptional regulator [Peptoclostridium litorale]KDR96075.1 putative transcriptional regulatory protein [Peptoclostridium litorale DSM 5388]SIO05255.1 DNA-binding regulatory protein, YebC/PmpR family [Peptoclostridium litorale DSM 5388]